MAKLKRFVMEQMAMRQWNKLRRAFGGLLRDKPKSYTRTLSNERLEQLLGLAKRTLKDARDQHAAQRGAKEAPAATAAAAAAEVGNE